MSGMLGFIGIAKESTWGTAVAATDYFEAMSENIVSTIDRFATRNVFAGLYEPDDATGVVHNAGDIVLGAHPHNVGYLLNSWFGNNTVTSVAATYYTNVFVPATTLASSQCPLPSYTIEVFRPNGGTQVSSSFQYAGAVVNKLTFDLKANQDLLTTANFIAQAQTQKTKTSPTIQTSPTQFFTFDTASISLGGVADINFEDIKLEFDNMLEGVVTLNGSTTISRIRRKGPQTIRISGTAIFEDFTDFNSFTAQTEQRLTVNLTKSQSFVILFDFPRAVFNTYPIAIKGRDALTVGWDMIARYHVGSTNACKVTLTTTNTF